MNNEKPEVMAGQHRIEALRVYVKYTSYKPEDLWWVCEFYDKGAHLFYMKAMDENKKKKKSFRRLTNDDMDDHSHTHNRHPPHRIGH
jgi:hypothetical protein